MESDAVLIEVDVAAHEAMDPVGINEECSSEEIGVALIAGAADEDDGTAGPGLQIELPVCGECSALRRRFATDRRAATVCGNVVV